MCFAMLYDDDDDDDDDDDVRVWSILADRCKGGE
jgi:hypothetical protein